MQPGTHKTHSAIRGHSLAMSCERVGCAHVCGSRYAGRGQRPFLGQSGGDCFRMFVCCHGAGMQYPSGIGAARGDSERGPDPVPGERNIRKTSEAYLRNSAIGNDCAAVAPSCHPCGEPTFELASATCPTPGNSWQLGALRIRVQGSCMEFGLFAPYRFLGDEGQISSWAYASLFFFFCVGVSLQAA